MHDNYFAGVRAAFTKYAGFAPEKEQQMIARGLQKKLEKYGPVGAARQVTGIRDRAAARAAAVPARYAGGKAGVKDLLGTLGSLFLLPLTAPIGLATGRMPFYQAADLNAPRRDRHLGMRRTMESALRGAQPFDDPSAQLSRMDRLKLFAGGVAHKPAEGIRRPIAVREEPPKPRPTIWD